jgi:hypothetical protein
LPFAFTKSLPDSQAQSTETLESAMKAVAELDVAGSSTESAVIVTVGVEGTWDGAKYKPDGEIVPHPAPAQPELDTLQLTRLSSAF